jgi:hypothetical protein
MDVREQVLEQVLAVCETKVQAVALLASGAFEVALKAADDQVSGGDEQGPRRLIPEARAKEVFRRAGRVMRRVTEQLLTWTQQYEALANAKGGGWLQRYRKEISKFANTDGLVLAKQITYLNGESEPESTETPAQEPSSADERGVELSSTETVADLEAKRKRARVFPRMAPPVCPECRAPVLRRESKYGPFMVCSRLTCKGKLSGAALGVGCPEPDCGGQLYERSREDVLEPGARVYFVGCSNFQTKGCKFAVWESVERVPCFRCKLPFVLLIGNSRRCINVDCDSAPRAQAQGNSEAIEDVLRFAARRCEGLDGAAEALRAATIAMDELRTAKSAPET